MYSRRRARDAQRCRIAGGGLRGCCVRGRPTTQTLRVIRFCPLRAFALSATVLLSFALTTPATLVRAEPSATLAVRLYNTAGVPSTDVLTGRREAERMLRETGLHPVLRYCGRAVEADSCDSVRGRSEVVVRLINAPAFNPSLHPDAFGVAYVLKETDRGWLATVFPDRIAIAAGRVDADAGLLLGRVIAHEIGHLLLGVAYHGDAGVMRAVWTDDRLAAHDEQWRFSIGEAVRMQHRLATSLF